MRLNRVKMELGSKSDQKSGTMEKDFEKVSRIAPFSRFYDPTANGRRRDPVYLCGGKRVLSLNVGQSGV